MCDWKKIAMFAGGALFGSAGIKLLTSSDAKKVYTQGTAAVLRMKDCAMQTVTRVQENCGDILADAKDINEARAAAAEQVVEDAARRRRGISRKTETVRGCGRFLDFGENMP